MNKILAAATALTLLAGTASVYARDHRPPHHSVAPEDRAAMADARIAALKAGLKLTPEQDKLWPPLETSLRDYDKLKLEQADKRHKAHEARREAREAAKEKGADARKEDRAARLDDRDPVAALKMRADMMGSNAAALKKIADAADPLYKTLDDGQKRRLQALMRLDGKGPKWHKHEQKHKHKRDHGADKDD